MALHSHICHTTFNRKGTHHLPKIFRITRIKDPIRFVFVDDIEIPMKGVSIVEVQENIKYSALTWAGQLRDTGGTIWTEKLF